MHPTPYPDVNAILAALQTQMQAILDGKLAGLYLYGSLVWGDFDADTSDMDLLAALTSDLTEQEFDGLHAMHQAIVAKYPSWEHRIEIAYLSITGLRTFRTQSSPIGIISPGEPFHIIQADKGWLMNWYMVREIGVTLYGPPPTDLIAPIAQAEFVQAVQEHAAAWSQWIAAYTQSRPSQAYAILTLCRALYTSRFGTQLSKKQAALWVSREYPQWAELVTQAPAWRAAWRDTNVDPATTQAETKAFVRFACGAIMDQPRSEHAQP